MRAGGFDFEYLEVDGNHGRMVPMVWPAIFDFFDHVSARDAKTRAMRTLRPRLAVGLGAALCIAPFGLSAQTEIRLWPDGAPGSESWSLPESVSTSASGDRVLANVSDPTLSVFLPDPAIATGAAVVIAPGGALRVLAFDNEGVKAAKWLNEHGIAGFVLKYRTLQQDPAAPRGPLPGFPAPGSAPRRSS